MAGPGAALLSRAVELLGAAGCELLAPGVSNCELLDALAAGELSDVLVCARRVGRSKPAPPPPPAPATLPAAASSERLAAGASSAAAEAAGQADAAAAEPSTSSAEAAAPETAAKAPQADAVADPPVVQPHPVAPPARQGLWELHACRAGALPLELQGFPAVHLSRVGSSSRPLHAAEEVNAAVACTLLPGCPSLSGLNHLLAHVLAPWLAAQQPDGSSTSSEPTFTAATELLATTHKLAAQAAACAKHLRSEVALALPTLPPGVDLADPASAAGSEEAVLACERCMEEWVGLCTGVLQRESAACPANRGPLAELDLWQNRAEAYGGLLEQLSVPAVRRVQEVVERGSMDANLAASFRAQLTEMARLSLEARDNARFLLTLERHFRALESGHLAAVADALQPMLNALRMIWCVSRHYGDDVHMSGLLERIAFGLQDRLDGALDLQAVFQAPAAEALALVRTCRAIAQGWPEHYLSNRERIESSGHCARWEFSRQLLFERTNHAAEVCGELEGMLQAVDDFRRFLGPELQAVTGDAGVIGEVSTMVQAMVEPVEGLGFKPLDRAHAADWRAAAARFACDADDVKLATRDLIDTCFRRLRSVDAAAELLHSFQRIQAQGAMQQQMADKLAAVLEHFIREIQTVRRLFEVGRDDPPLTRNMPPVAGSIQWSRTLLARVRRTWVRLQGLNGKLEALDAGRRAAMAMTDLARSVLQYEKERFAGWSATVDATVAAGLQQPLLIRQAAPDAAAGDAPAAPSAGASGASGSASGVVSINFSPALLCLAREAKYLDQLGYSVPQAAANLALQEGQLREHFQELGAMLERHGSAGASLRSAERALLGEQLAALDRAVDPGLARLNWTSLTIPHFVAGVNKAVDQFGALAAQVQKNVTAIDKVVWHISRAQLVPHDAPSAAAPAAGQAAAAGADPAAGQGAAEDVPDLQEFYEDCEQHRQQVVAGLVARYRTIGPLLVKVEELVAGTVTGKSRHLAGYYAYCEKRLLGAIIGMVMAGLQAFHDRLRACGPAGGQEGVVEGGAPGRQPLFRVSLSLMAPEVVVSPSTSEASKQLGRLLRNLVESAKPFVRWMDGTCAEAPEQYVYGEDAEPFVFSFFADVSQSPSVIRAMLMAQHEVQRACMGVGKVAERWRVFGGLWKADRVAALAKFRARKPSLAAVEERMAQYHALGEDAWAAGADCDVHFIRVRCSPLAAAVRAEAKAWVKGLGEQVLMADAPEPGVLRQQATELLAAVQMQPADEEDLEKVMAAISSALAAAPDALAACSDVEEGCHTRLLYCTGASDADTLQAELAGVREAQAAWVQLQAAAAEREAQGASLPMAPTGAPSQEPVGSEASGAASSLGRRPSGVRSGSAARLARTASSLSSVSSASNRPRQPRGPSRARPAEAPEQDAA